MQARFFRCEFNTETLNETKPPRPKTETKRLRPRQNPRDWGKKAEAKINVMRQRPKFWPQSLKIPVYFTVQL